MFNIHSESWLEWNSLTMRLFAPSFEKVGMAVQVVQN